MIVENTIRAVVLCPGPSVVRFNGPLCDDVTTFYNIAIAVNRAAGAFGCDWWVCLDARSFAACEPMGTPKIVCSQNQYRLMCAKWPQAAKHKHKKHWPGKIPTSKCKWNHFGSTVAIELAFRLGAVEIDAYGVDWDGKADFDGYTDTNQVRNADRWRREAEIFGALAEEISRRGGRVRRIEPVYSS